MLKENEKILFVDLETGGIDPLTHSILSIGLVVWSDLNIVDSLELCVNDGVLNVTSEALEINKINLETHKKKSLSSKQAIEKVLFFIQQHFEANEKITLAGHNVNFDVNFLRYFFKKNNVDFNAYFSHRFIDTSSILYYLYFSGKLKKKCVSSDEAFQYFRISVSKRHTALDDAKATAELFNKLLVLESLPEHQLMN